jgi:hypothetical protein
MIRIFGYLLFLGKRISTVSNALDMDFDHRELVKSLERMIEERTFDITLVQQLFIDKVFSLFNIFI